MDIEKFIINCKVIDSKNELFEKIKGDLILGINVESGSDFYIFTLLNSYSVEVLRFGLISELQGIKPTIIVIEKYNILIIGYNDKITAFNINEYKRKFELKLNNLFLDILIIENEDLLLVLNETGIVAINYKGEEKWSYETDLIIDYKLKNRTLFLEFSDDSIELCIDNGYVLD